MKILIVSQHFWPENFRINKVAGALQNAGCQVIVLTGQPNYPDVKVFPGYRAWRTAREIHPSGCTIVRVPIIPRGKGGAFGLIANYLSFLGTSIFIGYWQLRRQTFDVVFVYGTSPLLQGLTGVCFSVFKRAPLIMWVQDLWPESLSSTGYVRSPFILNRVARVVEWVYRRCDLVLVQSRSFAAHVAGMSGRTPVVYYPNPGDVERGPDEKSAGAAIELPNGFNVTFAGNLGIAQSLETVLDAAERLRAAPDVNLVIFGSGSRLDWITQEVKQRSLTNVYLLGRFESHVVTEAMARSDALLVSLKNSEGLNKTIPSKLSTYLGVGRPIIACMNGEGADVVRAAGAGLVCEAENADRLVKAILELKATPRNEREVMGAAGRRWYEEHFEPKKLTEILIEHFQAQLRERETNQAKGLGSTIE
jgi:glycosyltransferase involved in cell wall biosynthesis